MKPLLRILITALMQVIVLHSQEITIKAPSNFGTKDYHSIAVSSNGNAVIVGNGIIVTSDQNNVHITASDETVFNDIVHTSGTVFIVVTSSGTIKRSSDNGTTWNTVHNQKYTLNSIACLGTLCIAVGDYGTILISEDNGITWNNQKRKTTEHLFSAFIQENTLFCAGNGGTIIRSPDKGKTWEGIEGFVNDDLHFITFINNSIGFLGGANGNIYRTDNSGITWQSVVSDTNFSFQKCHRNNALLIATGSKGSFYMSNDNGNSWSRKELPFQAEWINGAATLDNNIVLVGDRGMIYTGKDNLWAKNTNVSKNRDLYCITKNSDRIFTGGRDGSLQYSTDEGKNWTSANISSTTNISTILHNNNDVYAFCTADSTMLYSSDKGEAWLTKRLPCNSALCATMYMDNNKKYGFFGGKDGLYFSEDFLDWKVAASGVNTQKNIIYSIESNNVNTLYAVGEKGLMLKHMSGGENWTLIPSLTDKNLYDIAIFTDGKDILSVGEKGLVLYSDDNGNSWKKILVDTLTWKSVIADDSRNRFILTSIEGIIYIGKNETWQKITTANNLIFNSAKFDETLWFCGTDGYVSSMPITATDLPNINVPNAEDVIVQYNVSEDKILIWNNFAYSVNVSIYTNEGIGTSLKCELGSNMKKAFSAQNLASGVYHCIIRIGNRNIYKPVAIMR